MPDLKQMRNPTAPVMINTAERRAFVMRLRISGAKLEDIADACKRQFGEDRLPKGYDRAQVCQDILRELEQISQYREQSRNALLALDTERLDRMLMSIWPQVIAGNFGAIDRALRILERRAKMFGIDSPTKVAPTTPDGEQPLLDAAEFVALLERTDKALKARTSSAEVVPSLT